MQKKSPEDEFYDDLDKKSEHKSCCSCQTMAILFSILLIIVVGATYYLYRKISQIDFTSKVVEFTSQDRKNFYDKLKTKPTDADTVELIFTSEELTASFSDGISIRNFLIKNIQVIINEKSLDFFGSLIKPLSSQIKITTIPTIKNEKIRLDVTEFNAGKLKFPKLVNSELGDSISALMDNNFKIFYTNYEVIGIKLKEDEMIITGKLKD